MTNEEAYARLRARGVSRGRALQVLAYAYQAQLVGGWRKLFITDDPYVLRGGSEGAKERAMDILRDAGLDPMAISFPERLSGQPPFGAN